MKVEIRQMLASVIMCLVAVVGARGQEPFRNIKSVNVDLFYQSGVSEESARGVADYLERDYDYLRKSTGLDLARRLEVRIYETVGKYNTAIQKQRSPDVALYRRGILHVQPPPKLEEDKMLAQSLSSALAFALLEGTSAKGCPQWLIHSFAVYHSGETANLSPPVGMNVSFFADLDQEIQQYPDPPRRNDVHFVLGKTMRFFVEEFGEEKAFGVFRAFDGKLSLEEVFHNSFSLEFPVLEKKWAAYVASSVVPIKKGSGNKK